MKFSRYFLLAACVAFTPGAPASPRIPRRLRRYRFRSMGRQNVGRFQSFRWSSAPAKKLRWRIYAAKFGSPILSTGVALTLARCRQPTWPNCRIVGRRRARLNWFLSRWIPRTTHPGFLELRRAIQSRSKTLVVRDRPTSGNRSPGRGGFQTRCRTRIESPRCYLT